MTGRFVAEFVRPMRIGELLVEQRKLRASDLTRALAEKPSDMRLASFLIAKGLVDFDDASRALGEQKRVACALTKHIAGRDPDITKAIPAELGRASCVLPIGRSSKGSLIVCVRDPDPALVAAIKHAVRGDVLAVVTPASRLEQLVADAYGKGTADELDIDFDISHEPPKPSRTISPRRVTTPAVPIPAYTPLELPADPLMPPLPDMDALDPESIRLSLTDLDDARVDKDPGQSGQLPKVSSQQLPIVGTTQPLPTMARVASSPRVSLGPSRPASPSSPPPQAAPAPRKISLESLNEGLAQATSREAATDVALEYVATRWTTGLVLGLRERAAIGYRGYRVVAPESVTVSLGSPSTVQRAVQSRFVSVETPQGVGQSALSHALGGSRAPAAAPIIVGVQVVAVIAVGDPIDGVAARDLAAADLAALAEALATAYARFMR
jgi:hypothetical protein